MAKQTSPKFDQLNNLPNKQPILVVTVDGYPNSFSTANAQRISRYDDAGLNYDTSGISYDIPIDIPYPKNQPIVDRKSTKSTIMSQIEPWDGKSSIETFNLTLIDYKGIVTQLLTPGLILPDIANSLWNIYLGFQGLSFPEDYVRLFQGYVNSYKENQGKVELDLTDPSTFRRQQIFNAATSTVNAAINTSQAQINVGTGVLYQSVLDGKGNLDPNVIIGINIGDEIMFFTDRLYAFPAVSGQANIGNGSIGSIKVFPVFTVNEIWTITCLTGGPSATFSVVGSVSGAQGTATVGSLFTAGNGAIQFLISNGSTNFSVSDRFTIQAQQNNVVHVSATPAVPGGSNVGNGTLGSQEVQDQYTVTETWTVTAITAESLGVAATFSVVGSVSGAQGTATEGIAFTSPNGAIQFTILGGSTFFAINDVFTFTTTAASLTVQRGSYNTAPESHSVGDTVKMFILFNDNPITIALKLMLSGIGGPWVTGQQVRGIINTDGGPSLADSITWPAETDLVQDLGLSVGDFLILSGFTHPQNNGVFTIASFQNNNRTVTVEETGVLVEEDAVGGSMLSGTIALRSKYDTYPLTAGLSLTPEDVLVSQHEYLRDTFIQFDFSLPQIADESSGKTYIETHIFKVIGGYSLAQGAKISMGLTHPPLAADLTKVLDHTNVIDAKNITVERSLSDRYFYNEIQFNYGWDPIGNTFAQTLIELDDAASQRVQQVSVLSIDCRGLPFTPQNQLILQQRAARLLLRYKYGAELISLKTFFGVGCLIDGGDIVILSDKLPTPVLQICNTQTGQRGIYSRVMEVASREIDMSAGNASLKLLSNNGFAATDRYAVISPASVIQAGNSATQFRIQNSFGNLVFPGLEWEKWQNLQGLKITVHDPNWIRVGTAVFTISPLDNFLINCATSLGFTPQPGDIMQLANYDESSVSSQTAAKNVYAYLGYTGNISAGGSSTSFTLQSGQGSNYQVGAVVSVRSPDGLTRFSPDVKIINLVGDNVTVGPIQLGAPANLGFTPLAGDYMRLGGFKDGGNSYRLV